MTAALVTNAERIFAANFPGLYRAGKVIFPKPEQIDPPRGKLAPEPFAHGPTLAQPGVRLTPEIVRIRRDTELERKRDHLCLTCGQPAKFYPERAFNQWGRFCSFHADLNAAESRANRSAARPQTPPIPPDSAPS